MANNGVAVSLFNIKGGLFYGDSEGLRERINDPHIDNIMFTDSTGNKLVKYGQKLYGQFLETGQERPLCDRVEIKISPRDVAKFKNGRGEDPSVQCLRSRLKFAERNVALAVTRFGLMYIERGDWGERGAVETLFCID